jgi:hypothetical protein
MLKGSGLDCIGESVQFIERGMGVTPYSVLVLKLT